MSAKLAEALSKAQAEMTAAPMNRVNPHFKSKYADLPSVIEAVRPALTKNGLSITQTTQVREAGLVLVTTLHHSSGESVASEYPLPIGKPQEMGSALTYARRYCLSAICCIAADDDDDANASESAGQRAAVKPNPVKPAKIEPPAPDKPALIPVQVDEAGANWLGWGGQFVAALKACRTPEQINAWLRANDAPLGTLRKEGPEKVAKRVNDVIKECLAATSQAPQEAA